MPSEEKFLVPRFSTAGDEQIYTSITVELKLQTDTKTKCNYSQRY